MAITDLRTFKIHNSRVLALLLMYYFFAVVTYSPYEILSDITLGLVIFGVSFLFYLKNVVGGGDAKFLPVAALFVGAHFALQFSVLLLAFTGTHLFAVPRNWLPTLTIGDKRAISYAPSVAAALICIIVLDCL